MNYKCKYCLLKSTEKLIDKLPLNNDKKEILVCELLNYISKINGETLTPEATRETQLIFNKYINLIDPCISEKRKSNDMALLQYKNLKETVLKSDNPFDTALRISIAGNIMDIAANPEFFTDYETNFNKTLRKVLSSEFAIDNSLILKKKIKESNTILILGDNAGEIVMDKLFLETIAHPNVYYAVRGKPIINDATLEDAEYVKIGQFAKVISNGYDAPSTIIDKCSDEFLNIYNKADLIISKGQGNLEGLMHSNNKKIFFLLMVKCEMIAEKIGVKKGDFVVMQNSF